MDPKSRRGAALRCVLTVVGEDKFLFTISKPPNGNVGAISCSRIYRSCDPGPTGSEYVPQLGSCSGRVQKNLSTKLLEDF